MITLENTNVLIFFFVNFCDQQLFPLKALKEIYPGVLPGILPEVADVLEIFSAIFQETAQAQELLQNYDGFNRKYSQTFLINSFKDSLRNFHEDSFRNFYKDYIKNVCGTLSKMNIF